VIGGRRRGRRVMSQLRMASSNHSERGQSLVEFAMIVPVFVLILFGMLEFGFVFSHNLTLQYATREGARTGALLADGGSLTTACGTIDPDPYIIAAVQRVLDSPGSPIDLSQVARIRIYSANSTGTEAGPVDVWDNPGTGTVVSVDGQALAFTRTSQSWQPCNRDNASVPPQSIGVSLTYTYKMVTPLSAIYQFFGPKGPASLPMTDKTVMALNPKTT
jgi:hypothetical protein